MIFRSKYLQPKKYFYFLIKKIKNIFSDLENYGERVDVFFTKDFLLDENTKCHLKRYEFATSHIDGEIRVADFACGTGYGSAILAEKAKSVLGLDINHSVINSIRNKYKDIPNLSFVQSDLLQMNFKDEFDCIVSFETVEHFAENDINKLFSLFHSALREGGKLIISTPYMQKDDQKALKTGFHKTFFIDENKIKNWMEKNNFKIIESYYQSYDWPVLSKANVVKEFIVCVAEKI